MKTIDFKTFEAQNDPVQDSLYRESGGLLRKAATAKKWSKIGIGKSQVEGLGVWSLEPIVDNETVEECPVLIVNKKDIVDGPLMDHVFKVSDDTYALALGYGSLYNHRNQPNVRWHYDDSKQALVFRASRAIQAGEELFISYGKDYFKTRGSSMKGDVNLTNTAKQK